MIERDGILADVRAKGGGDRAPDQASSITRLSPRCGRPGLLIGIELTEPVAADAWSRAALDAGFIINAATPTTVRLAPPLIVTAEQLGTFVSALPGLLDQRRWKRTETG